MEEELKSKAEDKDEAEDEDEGTDGDKDEDKAEHSQEEEEDEDGGSCRKSRARSVLPAGRSRGLSLQPDKLRPPEPRREIGPRPL